jgi:hypothetical protein
LHQIYDQSSKSDAHIPVAISHLLNLSAASKRLVKLKENPKYRPKFQMVRDNVTILYSSLHYTLDAALNGEQKVWDERSWESLYVQMINSENTGMLRRLHWYRDSLTALLDYVVGPTSMRLPPMDARVETLLGSQQVVSSRQSAATRNEAAAEPTEAAASEILPAVHSE